MSARAAAWSVLACALACPSTAHGIVGGQEVADCGFPSVVTVNGPVCTGVLVHPRIVVTAAHCGQPRVFGFGNRLGGPAVFRLADHCERGPGEGFGADVQWCVLDHAVTDIPFVPPLMGCEVDTQLSRGRTVVMVGFGRESADRPASGGVKRWATGELIEALDGTVRARGDGASPCKGDSGGPLLVRLGDGSWRVAGISSGSDCDGEGSWDALAPHVARMQATTGLDVTPCAGADGGFTPGSECGAFDASGATGGGSWFTRCADAPRSPASTECSAVQDNQAPVPASGCVCAVPLRRGPVGLLVVVAWALRRGGTIRR